jgi:hypothetical protein
MAGEDSAVQTDTTLQIYPVTFSVVASGRVGLPTNTGGIPVALVPGHSCHPTHGRDQTLDTQRNLAKT